MNNLKKYYDYGFGDFGGNIENKEVRNREIACKELMKPRYLVISDYPNSQFDVGQILELRPQGNTFCYDCFDRMYDDDFKKYDKIFRPLKWWQKRQVKEMPKYIKVMDDRGREEIRKVRKWDLTNQYGWICTTVDDMCPHESRILPATLSHHESFTKK